MCLKKIKTLMQLFWFNKVEISVDYHFYYQEMEHIINQSEIFTYFLSHSSCRTHTVLKTESR